jgi:hypothetical protein
MYSARKLGFIELIRNAAQKHEVFFIPVGYISTFILLLKCLIIISSLIFSSQSQHTRRINFHSYNIQAIVGNPLKVLAPMSIHMFSLIISAAVLLSPSLGYTAVTRSIGPNCYDFFIPINATSLNRQIEDYNLTTTASIESLIASLETSVSTSTYITVTTSFNISARYCEPEVKIPSRASSIQFLVHGITYTKNYWSALGFPGYDPDKYSWIQYASQRGYPTLSIDRVGYGNSSHPDPFGIDQIPMQTVVLNQIMQGLKAGDVVQRKFCKVIYVGHSLGSVLGKSVAAAYPDGADALVLTGYSAQISSVDILLSKPVPAVLFSSRFVGLSTGYMLRHFTLTSRT